MKRETSKQVKVVFADKKVNASYLKLKKSKYGEDKELLARIDDAVDKLKENPFCGIEIPKDIIPKIYFQKYGVDNLWKYDMPEGWRLIYTNVSDEVQILAVLLEWFDHKEYERRFHY